MQNTPNYNLKKPDYTDFADVMDLNDDMDIIDTTLADKLDKTGDASEAKVATATTSSASYPIPAAGDTLKAILGKIRKFMTDIKAAFVDASVSGTTITLTKADGTTKQITTQDTWNANTTEQAGYVAAPTSSKPYYFWATDANGAPAWRASTVEAAYDHRGLMSADAFRKVYNRKSTDGSYDTDNAGKFTASTAPAWQDGFPFP